MALGLEDERNVRWAYRDLVRGSNGHAPRRARVLVEAMAPPGHRAARQRAPRRASCPSSPSGLGGVWTEAFGDVAVVPLPADAARVERALRSLRAAPLLAGTRTGAPVDVAAAAALAARAGALLLDQGLELLELNPVLVNAAAAPSRSTRCRPNQEDRAHERDRSQARRGRAPRAAVRARRARLGRRRRRRRPQRPDRRGLPRARGQLGARARAPRAPGRRVHARAPVPRRALRRQPLRLRRRPARRARHPRARPAPPRLPVLRRRPQPVGPVRGRHVLRPVARRRRAPSATFDDLGVVPKDIEGYWAYEHLFDEIRRKLRTGARDTWVGETPTRAEIEELLARRADDDRRRLQRLDRRGARRPHERPAAQGRALRPGRDRRLRRARRTPARRRSSSCTTRATSRARARCGATSRAAWG